MLGQRLQSTERTKRIRTFCDISENTLVGADELIHASSFFYCNSLIRKERESQLSGTASFSVIYEARCIKDGLYHPKPGGEPFKKCLFHGEVRSTGWMCFTCAPRCLSEGDRQTVNKSKPGSRQLSHEPCDQGQD